MLRALRRRAACCLQSSTLSLQVSALEGTRTPGLQVRNLSLYPLSYERTGAGGSLRITHRIIRRGGVGVNTAHCLTEKLPLGRSLPHE